jgi:hypothetical protein
LRSRIQAAGITLTIKIRRRATIVSVEVRYGSCVARLQDKIKKCTVKQISKKI